MRVDVVALLHVLENRLVVARHALGLQFVVAAARTHLGRGRDENLQFRIGEHRRADVATVHHNALRTTHRLLLRRHRLAHERQGGHRAHVVAHLERTNGVFHTFAVEIGLRQLRLGIEAETHFDLRHLLAECLGLQTAVGRKESTAQRIERHRAIHRTAVHINVAHTARQSFGHRTLAAGTVAVDGDHDFLHKEMKGEFECIGFAAAHGRCGGASAHEQESTRSVGSGDHRPLGCSVMSGTIISSIETPPCWKVSRKCCT